VWQCSIRIIAGVCKCPATYYVTVLLCFRWWYQRTSKAQFYSYWTCRCNW